MASSRTGVPENPPKLGINILHYAVGATHRLGATLRHDMTCNLPSITSSFSSSSSHTVSPPSATNGSPYTHAALQPLSSQPRKDNGSGPSILNRYTAQGGQFASWAVFASISCRRLGLWLNPQVGRRVQDPRNTQPSTLAPKVKACLGKGVLVPESYKGKLDEGMLRWSDVEEAVPTW